MSLYAAGPMVQFRCLPAARRPRLARLRRSAITTAKPETLERIGSIKAELPKYISRDFRINDVIAENWAGPEAEDFVHVRVVLEEDHPKLETQMRIDFRSKMRDHFDQLGSTPLRSFPLQTRTTSADDQARKPIYFNCPGEKWTSGVGLTVGFRP